MLHDICRPRHTHPAEMCACTRPPSHHRPCGCTALDLAIPITLTYTFKLTIAWTAVSALTLMRHI